MKAVLRRIRISPKKANLVAGMVRGKKVNEALALLKFMPKKGAKTIYKVIHSAASNAKNNFKQNINDLFITKLLVTKGPTYKRSLPISRGRTHPIMKRTSHITVEVGVMEKAEPSKAKEKAKAKEEKPVKKTITSAKSESTPGGKKPETKKNKK
jgi:large subunit ribosomal protein L22